MRVVHKSKLALAAAVVLGGAALVVTALSCRESYNLPPVSGPPLSVPEARPSGAELAERPLEVIHVSPRGDLTSPHLQIVVSFNKPMVELGKVEDRAARSPLKIEPAVQGKQRWLGSRTLTFSPDKPLPGSTTFKLAVPAGIEAADGSRLEKPTEWTFNTPRVRVARVYPSNRARWIRPDRRVTLHFNQPVNARVLEQHVSFVVQPHGKPGDRSTIAARVKAGRNSKQMVLHPATVFPKDARIRVKVDEQLTGAEGPLTMGKSFVSEFHTYGPFRVKRLSCTKGCDPEGSIYVRFSNPVYVKNARRAIRVNGRRQRGGSSTYATASIYLSGKFKPRERHKITIAGNLVDKFGQRLEKPDALSFTTGDYDPFVYVPLESGVLEADSPRRMPIYFRNAEKARLVSKPLGERDVAAYLGHDDYWDRDELLLDDFPGATTRALRVSGRPNRRVVERVDLGKLLGGKGRGVVALELETRLKNRRYRSGIEVQRLVVRVTDLAITAKYAPHSSLVWVTSLRSGKPVPGARVAIWRPKGDKPLWTGVTDAGGLAAAPGVSKLAGGRDENHKFIFFADKDGDRSYVLSGTQGGLSPWEFGITGTWEDADSSLLGMIFTDRGIFRPGDKVHIKGILRRTGARGLDTPADEELTLSVTDSRGEELARVSKRLSEFGSFHHELKLPAGAALGSYAINARLARGGAARDSFRVEEYRAAEFKVSVDPGRKQYVRGDELSWRSTGAYLFGAPMREAKARWYVHWRSSGFRPPEHDGFVFADEVRWWDPGDSRYRSSGTLGQGQGRLGTKGEMSKTLQLKPPAMTGPRSYEIETTVTDVSRQSISSRAHVLLHPGEFYIGVKPNETFFKAGETMEAGVVAVTAAGKRLPGQRIRGTLTRRTWHAVRKKGMGGAHYFVTRHRDTQVGTCAVVTGAKPRPCAIKVRKAGYHFLRLTATDRRGNPLSASYGMYVTGPDYVPWRRTSESRLELVTDRKQYKVGQVARIMVKSPFRAAHGLFTVERNGVLTRKPIKLDRTARWLEVPITRDLVPNAYVSVMLVRGRVPVRGVKPSDEEDPGRPVFKVGYAKLSISQESRRLRVKVKPAREQYRPGQRVEVDLQVRDARGKGVRSELTVFVADEGVLSLVGYRTPDPMSIFYAERGLSVRTADNRNVLISRHLFADKGKKPGGGGGEMGAKGPGGMRSKFVTTPYFNPAVITDGAGRARVSFELPDNLTTFRIMAVATSATADFGSSHSSVKVNKPVLMLPTLPRLVRVNDTIEAGVVVHNHSGKGGTVSVTAEAQGVQLTGPAMRSVQVEDGGSGEARFAFRASAPGTATFRFKARLDDYEDGLELERPVKLPVVMESVATYGATETGVAEGVLPSKGIRPDVGGLEVSMASSAMVGLKGGVEYLLDYPYECLEQTTSRMVPLVLMDDLMRAYQLKPGDEVKPLVGKLIARLEQLQRWSGGFSYWASTHHTHPWASAYAAWGLSRARKAGHGVSERALKRSRSYLKSQLRGKLPKDESALALTLNTRAYLAYVLVELGEKVDGDLSTLYDRRDQLAYFGKALLLSAMVKAEGDAKMIAGLSEELLNQVHQTAKVAKVEENLGDGYAPLFHSSLRSTAMVLEALLLSRPDHPVVDKLVTYIVQQRKDGHWRNTQETVYALLGLHTYFQVKEKVVPSFEGRVVLGDRTLIKKSFKGRTLDVHQQKVPMKQLLGSTGPLGFIKQGSGRLHYSARLRYARKELPEEPWDEGFYVTRTYERVPQDVTSFSSMRGDPHKQVPGVTEVKAGDLVRVTLRIVVPQQMHFVVVDDPLPAGLEPVNFRLMTASRALRRSQTFFGYGPRHSHRRHRSRWYTPFYHQELRDDRVQLFADSVPPGVHAYVYMARATTIGSFVAPPTHVEQMYEPEVFGRTGAVTFKVNAK